MVCVCVYKHTCGSIDARGELLAVGSPYTFTWIPGMNSDHRLAQKAPLTAVPRYVHVTGPQTLLSIPSHVCIYFWTQ